MSLTGSEYTTCTHFKIIYSNQYTFHIYIVFHILCTRQEVLVITFLQRTCNVPATTNTRRVPNTAIVLTGMSPRVFFVLVSPGYLRQ